MGDNDFKLNWVWPLVSYKWIPEILDSFETLLEPSWSGLQREMTTEVPNPAFGNRIFFQLQTLLEETGLVKKNGRFISPAVKPTLHSVQKHLRELYEKSSSNWAVFFRHIYTKKILIEFQELKNYSPTIWPQISQYSIFRQWCEFFEFIGYGFLLNNETFFPDSVVTKEMAQDINFIEKCIKRIGDPRKLTGCDSLHSDADFLSWTKGEDHLPISNDMDLFPRIPLQSIFTTFYNSEGLGRWKLSLDNAIMEWKQQICNRIEQYDLFDIESAIYSWKIFLDLFIFGNSPMLLDENINEKVQKAKEIWEEVPNFKISVNEWRLLPIIYKDVTKLFFGSRYLRNSLKRPNIRQLNFLERHLHINKKVLIDKISIRGYRSKRTIQSLQKLFSNLNSSLKKVCTSANPDIIEKDVLSTVRELKLFLSYDKISLSELLNELSELINISEDDIINITNHRISSPNKNYSDSMIIRVCYWVHKRYSINRNPIFISINRIRDKIINKESELLKEIEFLDKDMDIWNTSLDKLKIQLDEIKSY